MAGRLEVFRPASISRTYSGKTLGHEFKLKASPAIRSFSPGHASHPDHPGDPSDYGDPSVIFDHPPPLGIHA